jgi:signal transduction histidine kinase
MLCCVCVCGYGFELPSVNIEADTITIKEIQSFQKQAKNAMDTNVNEALGLVENALDLANSIEHDSLVQRIENSKALYLLLAAKYKDARTIIERLIPLYEKQDKIFQVAVQKNRLANIGIKLENFEMAEANALNAIDLLKPKYKRQLGISNTYLGEVYRNKMEYKKAFKHIQAAIEYQESRGNHLYINMALSELGRLQWDIEDYDGSRSTFEKAIDLDFKNDQFLILPNLYLGKIDYNQGNYSTSKSYILKALSFIEKTGNASHLAETYLYLGKIMLHEKDFAEANRYSKLSRNQAQLLSNIRQLNLANILSSQIAYQENRFDDCINLSEPTYAYAKKENDLELSYQAAELLSKSHLKLNDLNKAYKFQSIFQKAKESFDENKNAIHIKGLTTQFSLEKQKATELFEKEQLILTQKNQLRELLFLGLILVLISLFLFGLQRQKSQLIKQLEEKNNSLLEAEIKLENLNKQLSDKNSSLTSYIDNKLQLENFTHIASNDLKAPLREQASFIQFLKNEAAPKLSEKEQLYMDYISLANEDMQSLIDDMIEYSHLKSSELSFAEADPLHIVKEAEYVNRDIIIKANATVEIGEMPSSVKTDKYKLVLAFRNLIRNSLLYKKENTPPTINIGGETRDNQTVFWVKDNGRGIAQTHIDQVFSLFKRLTNNKEVRGNGLGLTMVKEVIDKHKGKIWIESEIDKGTTVYFSIPT